MSHHAKCQTNSACDGKCAEAKRMNTNGQR
jgi:hypothetical protein